MKQDVDTKGGSLPFDEQAIFDQPHFGWLMRAAREEAGYTVERTAMLTRISFPFIEALENEELDKLPGVIFARGFIRNLAKFYGTDSQQLLAAYEYLLSGTRDGDADPSNRDEKRHQQLKRGIFSIQSNEWKKKLKTFAPHHYLQAKPLLTLTGGLVLAILLVKVWIGAPVSRVTPSFPSQVNSQVAVSTPPALSRAPQAPNSDSKTSVADQTAPTSGQTIDGQLQIELRVSQPVSVTITKDSEKQKVIDLIAQTYQFGFEEQLKLQVDNDAAVEIYFKGHRVGSPNPKGEMRRFTFAKAQSEVAKRSSSKANEVR